MSLNESSSIPEGFSLRKSRKLLLCWSLTALLALWTAAPLFGQLEAGQIAGTVRDSSGAVISGATVTVKSAATAAERTVKTGDIGQYLIPGLSPGVYQVTVLAEKFKTFRTTVEVTVGGSATLDAKLQVGESSTVVEVVGGEAVEVNTSSQEIGQLVDTQQIAQLPSLTRNPYDFVGLAGNVSGGDRGQTSGNIQTSGAAQNGTDRGVGFSINGQRASGTEILLDGVENTNLFDTTIALLTPQDSVQEFRVITNNFDAQYGRASGGVVNVTTKSGTNTFHGSLWEYNRLSAYTANTYANDVNDVKKGKYTRNQFGFGVGGPIVKDKLFFYGSTEWLRVRSNAVLTGYVLDPALLALPALPANVKTFYAQNAGNPTFHVIPGSSIAMGNPALKNNAVGPFATLVPVGTPVLDLVSYTAPFDAGGDLPQNTYNLVGKVDYNLSDRTQMFFRYGRESLALLPGAFWNQPYSQYDVSESIVTDAYLLSATHSFSNNILASLKLNFMRDNEAEQYDTALQNTPTLFLYNNANFDGKALNLPGFFNQTTGVGGLPYGGPQNTIQINPDLNWTKGRHTMRFGGLFDYAQINRGFGAYAQSIQQIGKNQGTGWDNLASGTLSKYQVAIDPQGKLPCQLNEQTPINATGLPNYVQTPGCTITTPVGAPSFNRSYRYRDFALYAQDSWRVTPRFTFNYGTRYEYYGVQHNDNPNLDSNIYYGPGSNVFQQLRTSSLLTVPNSPIGELWKPSYGTVAPRIGFAYDLLGNGTASLRGGFGISYERNFGNVTFNMIQNPPASASVVVNNVPISADNLGPLNNSGLAAIPLPPVSPRHVNQNIRTAQTQFWSLALEKKVGKGAIIALEYDGAHGVHLYDIANFNMLGGGNVYLGDPLNTTAACTTKYGGPCFTYVNPAYSAVNTRGSSGYSHYDALNIRFQTQNLGKSGLSIVTNYTWAHSLDNISSTFSESSSSSNGVGNLGYLDPRNPSLDYGNSDFDVRNRFVFSTIWDEPFFKDKKGFLRQVAGGWVVTPIFTARTGVPFTIADSTNSLNASFTGPYGIVRYNPSASASHSVGGGANSGTPNVFNLLTLPASASFGNSAMNGISDFGPYPSTMTGRNSFRGPGAWNLDLAVGKSFKATERVALEFRAEAFNIFNHHNMYVNGFNADAVNFSGGPVVVQGEKGGLGTLAGNGNHDERRFGQFALRASF